MLKTIHPFPARMAPELALKMLGNLPPNSIVLDPMAGSGTVIRHAVELGHRSIGFDADPLAVLMSRVWTTSVNDNALEKTFKGIVETALSLDGRKISLPWIDNDKETKEFIKYWFGSRQRSDLRRLACVLHGYAGSRHSAEKQAATDVVRIALSRIIITKEQGASLARDTSHSRPHKVADESDYDVFNGLSRSFQQVRKRLKQEPPIGNSRVYLGDARALTGLEDGFVDAVLTSPPYLNAIDYMRGHRLSLVWLGYSLGQMRTVRSNNIGAERGPDATYREDVYAPIQRAMCHSVALPARHQKMIKRYSEDVYNMVSEISRVTKVGGKVTLVVGNSCLNGIFVKNSAGVVEAASMLSLEKTSEDERQLPAASRYLPILENGSLGKRMRTESILCFEKV